MNNGEPLELTIDTLHSEDDSWSIESIMFNILNDYLQPNDDFPLPHANECLNALLPRNRPAWLRQENDNLLVFRRELFDLVWKIAKQIPCENPGQDKLIVLVRRMPYITITQTFALSSGEQVPAWAGFGYFEDKFQMLRTLKSPVKKCNPSQLICDQYVNASAFAARFFQATWQNAPESLNCPTRRLGRSLALNTIETAAEGKIPNPELLPCHYIAAAQWIILAGEGLWKDIRWGSVSSCEGVGNGRRHLAFPPSRWMR